MGGAVKRLRATRRALVLALAAAALAGSCVNPLNAVLQRWATLDMVEVQEGTLILGNASGYSDEQPTHGVTISTFLMARYEVTQGLYEQIMGTNPSWFTPAHGYADDPYLPVERVTWLEAVQFCNQLSRTAGLQPCYTIDTTIGNENVTCDFTRDGYRLPTEAEWEYAARGGLDTEGYPYAGSNIIDHVAWYESNAGNQTHPVGEKESNELGLYDMSGNVGEYCWDGYTGDYLYFYDPPYNGIEPFVNPHGPFVLHNDQVWLDDYYVYRGGSFNEYGAYPGDLERVSARSMFENAGAACPPASMVPYWSYDTGFRVVRRP